MMPLDVETCRLPVKGKAGMLKGFSSTKGVSLVGVHLYFCVGESQQFHLSCMAKTNVP